MSSRRFMIAYVPVIAAAWLLVAPHGANAWRWLLIGFVLFRAFDITKPPPIRALERLPGGWGVMADDAVAGVYACVVLQALVWIGAY